MADLSEVLAGPVLQVAPGLLGSVLRNGEVAVRITEVEAYDGANDPGSHAFNGPTARNQVMYGEPGHLYVYLSYGMHHCCNVVTGPPGVASAVLLRAGEIIDGLDTVRVRRPNVADSSLARGPANLCKALGIDRADNGADLSGGDLLLTLAELRLSDPATGPRVGLTAAPDRPWRFWIAGDQTVSAYRRSPRAPDSKDP